MLTRVSHDVLLFDFAEFLQVEHRKKIDTYFTIYLDIQ